MMTHSASQYCFCMHVQYDPNGFEQVTLTVKFLWYKRTVAEPHQN